MSPQSNRKAILASVLLVAMAVMGQSSKCPDITKYRTSYVENNYDPALMTGLWYEHMYIDIAQVASSCERLNATYNESNGVLTSDFEVQYGDLPFTITEVYTPPENGTMKGYYVKTVKEPGSKLLPIPTVVSDVQFFSASKTSKTYDTVILTSCLEKLGMAIHEIVFATRNKFENSSILSAMENTAKSLGIEYNEKALKRVDWTKKVCKNL